MFSLFVNVLRFLDFSLYRVYNSGYFSLCLRQQILRYAQDDRDGMKTILSAMLLAPTDPSLRSG